MTEIEGLVLNDYLKAHPEVTLAQLTQVVPDGNLWFNKDDILRASVNGQKDIVDWMMTRENLHEDCLRTFNWLWTEVDGKVHEHPLILRHILTQQYKEEKKARFRNYFIECCCMGYMSSVQMLLENKHLKEEGTNVAYTGHYEKRGGYPILKTALTGASYNGHTAVTELLMQQEWIRVLCMDHYIKVPKLDEPNEWYWVYVEPPIPEVGEALYGTE
jgi:hypothetical protein